MRVQLSRRLARDERGAIALLSAVLAISLVVFAAFAVDFGMAYTSKRQLQTAADAGALAAASYYAQKPGKCSALKANPTYLTDARDIAVTYVGNNRPNANVIGFTVDCNSVSTGQLTVDVTVDGSTSVGLGKLVFNSDTITTQRTAQARVEVPSSTDRLRPYMICSQFVPDPASVFPTGVTKVDFPSTSDSTGNCPHSSGNWFVVDCPHIGNGNNGNPDLAAATADGCSNDHLISIVDPQDGTSPSALSASLLAACPGSANFATYDPDCLSANPGNVSANSIVTAWNTLIAKHRPVVFPVFCGKPTCDPAAFTDVGGNNTLYPIQRLASAQVCGYHWGNKDSGAYTSSGPTDLCNGADASPGNNQDNYLLLAFTDLQVSGVLEESDCAPGDPLCDGGQRSVRLTK